MNKAIFLDKDGTLIVDVPYNVDPARIELYFDIGPALQRLQTAGYKLIVISNQAGVARGYFVEDALDGVIAALRNQLSAFGVMLDGFYYCPHHPDGSVTTYAIDCDCRKPQPGLIQRAARDHNIDLSQSWMVGDILNDVEAGNRAGCRTLLIDRGNETEWLTGPFRTPTATVSSLVEMADYILKNCV
jgi:D,D-heptose 1,7-bisphosphate phosphatase